jgi:hypothetical protein
MTYNLIIRINNSHDINSIINKNYSVYTIQKNYFSRSKNNLTDWYSISKLSNVLLSEQNNDVYVLIEDMDIYLKIFNKPEYMSKINNIHLIVINDYSTSLFDNDWFKNFIILTYTESNNLNYYVLKNKNEV